MLCLDEKSQIQALDQTQAALGASFDSLQDHEIGSSPYSGRLRHPAFSPGIATDVSGKGPHSYFDNVESSVEFITCSQVTTCPV